MELFGWLLAPGGVYDCELNHEILFIIDFSIFLYFLEGSSFCLSALRG